MLLFLIALFVLLAGSLPWLALARLTSKAAWVMGLYLAGSANLTLTLYITNLFSQLDQPVIILLMHGLLGGLGWFLWQRSGKPALQGPFQNWKMDFHWMRSDPVLSILVMSVGVAYLFALVQIIVIPQNNMDSLSTHLARIVFWRQHGSIFPWSTVMLNQVSYPINAQMQTYWLLLFAGNDRLVGIVQWLAAVMSGAGVYGVARCLGYTQRSSVFAGLLFLTFPLVALQATTTQTDLVVAVYFILAVYFLLAGFKDGRYAPLLLSAISVGLGIGVKKSYFILLPILAVVLAMAWLQYGRRSWKSILTWSLNLVLGIALFGAYIYVLNWYYLGDPFGSPEYIDLLLDVPQGSQEVPKVWLSPLPQQATSPVNGMLMELTYNAPRLLYQALDTSGLPDPWDGYSHKVKLRVVRAVFQWIGFAEIEGTAYTAPGHTFSFSDKNINEESHAWYGPLSFMLILPALFVSISQAFRKRAYLLLIPGLALLIFFPLEIIFRPGWDPYQGRYFAPIVALCASLTAMWFSEKGGRFHEWLIAGLAVLILFVTLLYNPSKPTLGDYAEEFRVWTNPDRMFIQTIQTKRDRWVYRMVARSVPEDATLGYYIPFYFMEYPLFGDELTRHLIPMGSSDLANDWEWQKTQGVEYLLLPNQAGIVVPENTYEMIDKISGWTLYARIPVP